MNNEITDLMDKYRECTRNIWNTYFRWLKDGSHEFINVNSALFQGLVLTQINDRFDHNKVYESIDVVPVIPPSGRLEVTFLPDEEKSGRWKISEITDARGKYNFMEFWDWRNPEDVMDNNFVLAEADDIPGNKEISGNLVLFRYEHVRFYNSK